MRILGLALLLSAVLAAAPAPRIRRVSFSYEATIQTPPVGTRSLEVWVPVPHKDSWQEVSHLGYEAPAGAAVLSAPAIAPASRPDLSQYLGPDSLVPLDRQIQAWTLNVIRRAGARTDIERARAIFDHVVATMTYDKSGVGWERGAICYACTRRRGNCTDFHAMFIGFCRAEGTPARFAIGFPIPPEHGHGTIAGYHCWAEFYARGIGWVPVDASEAAIEPAHHAYYFGAHDENRFEFSRGRDLHLTPPQAGPALNYFIHPYAEADGRPYAGVATVFRYLGSSDGGLS